MPTVKEYSNAKGFYIRSNIDGRFVTLQLSPEAEGLFADLGYRGGNQISWQFLKPLCDNGHAYTNNSGTEVETKNIDTEVSISSQKLSIEKKRRLEKFLDQQTPNNSTAGRDGSSKNNNEIDSGLDRINKSIRGTIEEWSPSDDEYEATLNRIARAGDVDGITKSIAHHSTEHPILVNRFRVSSQDIPTYSFDTDGIAWTVHDFRTVDKGGTDAELFFDIQPGTSSSQSITIGTESTQWHTKGEQFTEKQVDEFLTVGPDLLFYLHHLEGGPSISSGDIISNPTAEISSESTLRLDAFDDLETGESDDNQALGVVLSLNSNGYGRIRSHTGHTSVFSKKEVEFDSIEVGDVVTFEAKSHKDYIHAKNIHKEETDISGPEIVRNWPEWRAESPSYLRNNWVEEQVKRDTDKKSISLIGSNKEVDNRKIEVPIDSLTFYLVNTSSDPGDALDEAVRSLLKHTIDGEETIPREPVATTDVEISLPANLLSMVESLVGTSLVYETRGQFFNAALQQHLDAEDRVEMAVRVPRSYNEVAKQVAEEHGISTQEFMREAVEDALETELHKK